MSQANISPFPVDELNDIELSIKMLEKFYKNGTISDFDRNFASNVFNSFINQGLTYLAASRWHELKAVRGYVEGSSTYSSDLTNAWHAMPNGFMFISNVGKEWLKERRAYEKEIAVSLEAFTKHKIVNEIKVSNKIFQIINNYMDKCIFSDAREAAEIAFRDIVLNDRVTHSVARTETIQSTAYLSSLMAGSSGSKYQEEFNYLFLMNRDNSLLRIYDQLLRGRARYYVKLILRFFQ